MDEIIKEKQNLEKQLQDISNKNKRANKLETLFNELICSSIKVIEKINDHKQDCDKNSIFGNEIISILNEKLIEIENSNCGVTIKWNNSKIQKNTLLNAPLKGVKGNSKNRVNLEKIDEEEEVSECSILSKNEESIDINKTEPLLKEVNASNIKAIEEDEDQTSFMNTIENLKFELANLNSEPLDLNMDPKNVNENLVLKEINSSDKKDFNKGKFISQANKENSSIIMNNASKVGENTKKSNASLNSKSDTKLCIALCNFKAQKVIIE